LRITEYGNQDNMVSFMLACASVLCYRITLTDRLQSLEHLRSSGSGRILRQTCSESSGFGSFNI